MKMYRNSLNVFDVSGTDPDKGYVDGMYLNTSGEEYVPASARYATVTEYISVTAETTYSQDDFYRGSSGIPALVFYNNEKTYISAVVIKDTTTFTTPQNCAYIRISRTNTATESMLNLGGTVLPYEPYNVKDWYGYTYKLRSSGAWTAGAEKKRSGGAWV